MKRIIIKNADVVLQDSVKKCCVELSDDKITAICDNPASDDAYIIDASGCYVLPGFVDNHIHGGGGADFMDLTRESFMKVLETHAFHGTTTIYPTAVSSEIYKLEQLIDLFRTLKDSEDFPCTVPGLHLEGPFLSLKQSGAQNKSRIVPPTVENVDRLLGAGADVIKRIGIAPENDGAIEAGKRFHQSGAVISVAHSDALFGEVEKAYNEGFFNHITHLHCAAPWAHKINEKVQACIAEAAYLIDGMNFELIGDGLHISPQTIMMAAKFKQPFTVSLVTDAMRAAGQDGVTESYLGEMLPENRVIVEGGVAKLPDRTFFAGSIATSEIVFKNVCQNTNLPLPKIAELMSLAPSKLMGIDSTKGSITEGKDADIVIARKDDFSICGVISMGRIIRQEKPNA